MKLKQKILGLIFSIILGLFLFGCGGGGGGASDVADSTTIEQVFDAEEGADNSAPEDVTSLSAVPGDSKVTLSWTASADSEGDLAGQRVYYSSDGGDSYTAAESAISASTTSYEVTGLTNGTPYKFKVTSYDEVPNESSGATVSCYANSPLADSDFPVQSGLTDSGVARESTQTMTGTVPNPAGSSSETFGGKAYLVLNGDKIPISVTSASNGSGRTISKGGNEYYLDDADRIDFTSLPKEGQKALSFTWHFTVTFSVNSGANQIRIEIYDLSDALFAASQEWTIMGAVQPTSLVVTLWWDTNSTDMDLHVSPDDGTTHCYYGNTTAGGMVLDYDDTNGHGPEHVTVDDVTGTKTYKIKVYYYADHNDATETTPTTAYITAAVNGETKLDASQLMTVDSIVDYWGTGSHIWDAGELEVSAANIYTVTLGDPVLSSFPTVLLPVTVTDPNNNDEHVSGLTSDNFKVINAGTLMSSVNVTEMGSSYTLEFTDITCGKRDIYVYVHVPADGDTPAKGGLSNTDKTYGTNYALLVGLNEYPASYTTASRWDTTNYTIDVEPSIPTGVSSVLAAEFTIEFYTSNTLAASITASTIQSQGNGVYRLGYASQDHTNHTSARVKYEKESWLNWCIADIIDLEDALKSKAKSMTYSAWEDANIYTLTNSSATKSAVVNRIQTIADGMETYDLFLFHFSGHGSNGTTDESQYLCAYEDDAWISVTDLTGTLGNIANPGSNITNVFVFLDACHSGNFIGKTMIDGTGIKAQRRYRPFITQRDSQQSGLTGLSFARDMRDLTGTNLFVMTAVAGTKSSWDVTSLQNGVFSYYLVEGLKLKDSDNNEIYISAAAANANKDIWITGEEAYNYLAPKAEDYVETNIKPTYADAEQQAQYWPDLSTHSRLIYNW